MGLTIEQFVSFDNDMGGPAYPGKIQVTKKGETINICCPGMTILDRFAQAAMPKDVTTEYADIMFDEVANKCYEFAAAMLRARYRLVESCQNTTEKKGPTHERTAD